MADDDKHEKTEDATPRHRAEAREKGQVPISMEIVAALLLCGWAGALAFGGGELARAIGGTMSDVIGSLATLGNEELSVPAAAALLFDLAKPAGGALLLLLLPLFVLGVLASYGQIGFQLSPKAIEADLAKLDPAKGFGRMFSSRSIVRALLASLKIGLIAAVMAGVAWSQLDRIVLLAGADLGPALAGVGHVALRCVAGALLAILVLAAADAAYQRWQHERDLKMSRKEIREEHKSLEGDPHIKARIRRVQRELASRRMMSEVPKATVVVTNPTHYAVALRYERSGADGAGIGAPRVVAKGVDAVAARIKDVARESGVIVYEDVSLARALHARCELGEEVPVDLYQAVAEVLAYVYRVQGAQVLQGAS
jgi:flagellar biosynthesis protein FlhB